MCERGRFLKGTGHLWEFMDHLKYNEGDENHKKLLSCLNKKEAFTGLEELKRHDASTHPSYVDSE